VVLRSVLRLFVPSDGSIWTYLKSRDDNKVRLAIAQDRNRTEIELERERRATARELVEILPEGAEYRDSTALGWREIRKPQVSRTQQTHRYRGLASAEVLPETEKMKITLSGAMRARDVSRPSDEQLAAAARREEAAGRAVESGQPGHITPGAAPRTAPAPSHVPTDPRPTAAAGRASDEAPKPMPPRRRRRRRG
jgi:hypothetical protein